MSFYTPKIIFTIKTVFTGLLIYGSSTLHTSQELKEYYESMWGGRHVFFTNISLYITITVLLLSYIKRYKKENKTLEKGYKITLQFALGLEIAVTILYWVLKCINPLLITPRPDLKTGLLPNLCTHLFPLLSLIFECFTNKISHENYSIIITFIFGIFYYILSFIASLYNNHWPYPLLDKMNWMARTGFIAFICISCAISSRVVIYFIRNIKRKYNIRLK